MGLKQIRVQMKKLKSSLRLIWKKIKRAKLLGLKNDLKKRPNQQTLIEPCITLWQVAFRSLLVNMGYFNKTTLRVGTTGTRAKVDYHLDL